MSARCGAVMTRSLTRSPPTTASEELGVAEVNQRVDVMVGANGTGQGRMGWLALGWPEEFRRLAAVLPRMREMA